MVSRSFPARRAFGSRAAVSVDAWLLPYMAVPFLAGGRSFAGADCRGHHLLILEHERGVRVPEPAQLYASTAFREAHQLRDFFAAEAHRWRRLAEPEPFCCLLFGVRGGEGGLLPAHVGTSLGGSRFVHTRAGWGPQVADFSLADPGEAKWGERLLGAYVYDRA